MEISMRQTIDAVLQKIRDTRLSDDLHHGEVMHLSGYASGLMHARAITIYQWEEIRNQRDEAHQFWKENRK